MSNAVNINVIIPQLDVIKKLKKLNMLQKAVDAAIFEHTQGRFSVTLSFVDNNIAILAKTATEAKAIARYMEVIEQIFFELNLEYPKIEISPVKFGK
jgi:ATP-dependent protease Clp ATPase subunit